MISKGLVNLVQDSGVVHRGDNLSRHSPIYMTLDLGNITSKPISCKTTPMRYPDWEKASYQETTDYTMNLQKNLQMLKFPDSVRHCKDPLCKKGNSY